MELSRLLLVGDGAVARALAAALPGARRWYRAQGTPIPPCEVAWLAVSDGAIAEVGAKVGAAAGPRVILHSAGALPGALLGAAAPAVGVCHPLRALRGPVASFAGTVFGVEGDDEAVAAAEAIVKILDGVPLRLSATTMARYHAAAALAGNHPLALVGAAVEELVAIGLPRDDAQRALGGLLASAAENVRTLGAGAGLTGAVARGDRAAVARHLAALSPEALAIYQATLPALVTLAERSGRIDEQTARQLRQLVGLD